MARDFVTEPSPSTEPLCVSAASTASVSSRGLSDNAVTDLLQAAQKPETARLWVCSPYITFTPAVLSQTFGDGRALFLLTTINNRPAYWIIRGCSTWRVFGDWPIDREGVEFFDYVDEVLVAIEEEFGTADVFDLNSRGQWIDPETGRFVPSSWAEYPAINTRDGCSWSRSDWPDLPGVELEPHPADRTYRILARPAPAGEARQGQDAQRLDPKDDHAAGEASAPTPSPDPASGEAAV